MKHLNQFIKILVMVSLLAGLVSIPSASIAARSEKEGAGKQIVGYFTEWGIYSGYMVKNVATSGSADKLTVINYAFANAAPDASGQVTCQLFDEWADYQRPTSAAESVDGVAVEWPNAVLGNFQQLKALKALYPNLKVVISVGGWTGSKYFSDAALTPASRKAFVASCINLFIKGDLPNPGWGGMGGPGAAAGIFDGIDIDWEYPAAEGNTGNIVRPEDTQNFTALMSEFRRQLDAIDPHLLLTAALPAGPDKYSKIELRKVSRILDWINLMTYDFHGPWDTVTNFQSNLYPSRQDPSSPRSSVLTSVQGYLDARVPPEKIVVGTPFYGHGWTGVADVNHGLYQTAAGVAGGGSLNYNVLQGMIGAGGFTRYFDERTQAAWIFDGTTFWTLDDAQTLTARTDYVRRQDLAGIMFWELSGDDAAGTLINAIYTGLGNDCQGHHCH